ncbi:MAG: hypothetical protein EHM24_00960 [Acidobacteria bacterium]|nr:MAG: hypothetical protein EHM24_00960 [Acidobacteriota bacterium]
MEPNALAPLASPPGPAGSAAPAGTRAAASSGARAAERARVADLAREFEAMMMRQVLQQMREMLSEDEDGGLGADTMTATIDVELTRALAASRPMGLAAALLPALERETVEGGTSTAQLPDQLLVPAANPTPAAAAYARVATAPLHSATSGAEAIEPAVPLPIAARVSSGFGLRRDPFNGGERFHAGVDIAAPAGRQVPAVAAGQVSFAGTAAGYGNLIVIEHADGTSTRYAHLADVSVRKGEAVEAGRTIGTVGSTGRSTGPHLHFELRQNGRPVNPVAAAARVAGAFKNGLAVAD